MATEGLRLARQAGMDDQMSWNWNTATNDLKEDGNSQ
jgi:hypothetical protein